MINIKALNDKVYCEILEKKEKKLASGLIIAGDAVDEVMKNTRRGKVLSVGVKVETNIEEGDIVWFSRFIGTEIGENHIVISDDQLLGIELDEE